MAPIVPDFVQMAVMNAGNAAAIQLPNGPSTMCFDKDDFAQPDLNIAEFIAKQRRAGVPLETLKEDLGIYLDILETAMYDLINRDYQDFVSLSSNLVGLDSAIEDLSNPLSRLRTDIETIRRKMSNTLQAVNEALAERDCLRQKRRLLERLLAVEASIQRLQSLLGPTENPEDSLEEAAHEWVQLQTLLKAGDVRLETLAFVKERKSVVDGIEKAVVKKAVAFFKGALERDNIPELRQSMRIYAIIDRIPEAEDLFRQLKVAPQLASIFDKCVKSSKTVSQILTELYAQILDFVPNCLSSVKEILSHSGDKAGTDGVLRGFDLMAGAVWPEVAHLLTTRVNNIFSPGNPDAFHANYTITISFLTRLEGLCTSQVSVKRLRSHKSHVQFLAKWNLTVYFQIRFQEIAGTFETALEDGWSKAEEAEAKATLKATSVLLACLDVCWIPSVFLDPLLHRFWKLTLQLLSRYSTWMNDLMASLELKEEAKPAAVGAVGSQGDVPAAASSPSPSQVPTTPSSLSSDEKLGLIVALMSDVGIVFAAMAPLFQNHVWPRAFAAGDPNPYQNCLDSASGNMRKSLDPFVEFIIDLVYQQSSPSVKLVNDVPRKYRKTNREVPSKPSPYLAAMLDPLKAFVANNLNDKQVEREIASRVLTRLVEVYLRHVGDVLTSVAKMEESLKRLKKARGGAAAAAASDTVSDDDKIRLQLALDVEAWGCQVESVFGIAPTDLEHFEALKTLVVGATSGLSELVS